MILAFSTMDPYSIYAGPSMSSSLAFFDDQGNALEIGGQLRKGTFKTTPYEALKVTIMQEPLGPLVLASGDGSCEVTIESATTASIAGSFICRDFPVDKRTTMDVVATFGGTMPQGE